LILLEHIRLEKQLGHIVGSASDRTVSNQWDLWRQHGIEPDFVVLKHNLGELVGKYQVEEYWHVGDSAMDEFFAVRAGFKFLYPKAYLQDNGMANSSFT
jgi:hypothetical protein